MKAVLKKVDGRWVILTKQDGVYNEYRFRSEADAWVWVHLVGDEVEVVR